MQNPLTLSLSKGEGPEIATDIRISLGVSGVTEVFHTAGFLFFGKQPHAPYYANANRSRARDTQSPVLNFTMSKNSDQHTIN